MATHADKQRDMVEAQIGKILNDYTRNFDPAADVDYCDGYYIIFSDGSSLSVQLTALDAE